MKIKAKLENRRVNFTERVSDEREITGIQRKHGRWGCTRGLFVRSTPDLHILKN